MSNSDAQDTLLLLAGTTLVAVGASDLHLRYVKPQMQPALLVAGGLLLALAAAGALQSWREARATGADAVAPAAHGSSDHGLHISSWLLVLPLLVLLFVAPPALGSYAAARSATRIAEPVFDLPPLPAPRDGAVELSLTDYYSRVLYDQQSLAGASVRLTGFVTPVGGAVVRHQDLAGVLRCRRSAGQGPRRRRYSAGSAGGRHLGRGPRPLHRAGDPPRGGGRRGDPARHLRAEHPCAAQRPPVTCY